MREIPTSHRDAEGGSLPNHARSLIALVFTLAVVATHCGGEVGPGPEDAGANEAPSVEARFDFDWCPDPAPEPGSPCPTEAADCRYVGSRTCFARYVCKSGAWRERACD